MSRKPNYFNQIISLLNDLHKSFPNYNLGKHLSTALDGQDMWGISDKELLNSLYNYKIELEIDNNHHTDEEELQKIIKDGMNLSSILEEEEYNGEDY